ncbi:sugar nucleotide-binding protein [Paeniglutamicibacter sp. NPDC012692]|uniref:sugar nucleotide-binding protein n=1 Tax=Paeniglutamicibacter sp. NPDC012692 TaxID=3364388 RepID=UPI00367E140F
MKAPEILTTDIPGLLVVQLPVHEDARGWFKENWQREKMTAAGLPDFRPVQNNVSFNREPGTTRGIHAEPWDKYVAVVGGSVFGAWVDLRAGEGFGTSFTTILTAGQAVFVPRGVGNGFQTLEPNTGYSYLVTEHWSPHAQENYTFVNLADETANIPWPIPLDKATISDADKSHPALVDVVPVQPLKTLVIGGSGQLGRALSALLSGDDRHEFPRRSEFDLCNPAHVARVNWSDYGTVINAAAYTQVDLAESEIGRHDAWATNVTAVERLAQICIEHRITLVHVSSDYVFDGRKRAYGEEDAPCPLGVYGQTKAAGDALVRMVPRHYVIRTSWVVGEGKNFVATMSRLAQTGVNPSVVNDQYGRLSFTTDISAGIVHLLDSGAPYGVYNLTNDGEPTSWADIAKRVFMLCGHDPDRVNEISTADYFEGRPHTAPRPASSNLRLDKIQETGFRPMDQHERLAGYLENM